MPLHPEVVAALEAAGATKDMINAAKLAAFEVEETERQRRAEYMREYRVNLRDTNTRSRVKSRVKSRVNLQTQLPENKAESSEKELSRENGHIESSLRKKESKNTRNCYSNEFEQFWVLYPRKAEKKKAAKAYEKARKDVSAETILARLNALIPTWKDPQFIKYPATWLNGGCWDDQPTLELPRLPNGKPRMTAQEEMIDVFRR